MQDITMCSWASLLGLCAGSMQENAAKANESVEIQPKVAETIRAINFQEGQRVETGQSLVKLVNEQAGPVSR
jgi:multidrug resistance efflux pump